MKVLAIDIGGTHVKLLVTGQKEHGEFDSSPGLTPAMLLAGARKLANNWKYVTLSFGYPDRSVITGRSPNRLTWAPGPA